MARDTTIPVWPSDSILKHYNSIYESKHNYGKKIAFVLLFLILIPLAYYLFKNYTWVKK